MKRLIVLLFCSAACFADYGIKVVELRGAPFIENSSPPFIESKESKKHIAISQFLKHGQIIHLKKGDYLKVHILHLNDQKIELVEGKTKIKLQHRKSPSWVRMPVGEVLQNSILDVSKESVVYYKSP